MIFSLVFQKILGEKFSLTLIEAIYFILTKDEAECKREKRSSFVGGWSSMLELIRILRSEMLAVESGPRWISFKNFRDFRG